MSPMMCELTVERLAALSRGCRGRKKMMAKIWAIDKKTEQLISEKFFDDYYEKWLNMKISGLGGMTPLEASKTEDGRKELEKLLKTLENQQREAEAGSNPPLEESE